jgi:hypothetical protein
MRSKTPAAERDGRVQVGVGDDDARSIGVAFGGALDDKERVLFRVSGQRFESNGFRDNTYLDRDNTNGRKETSLRASNDLEVNLAALYTNIDNGYDAFALDNSYTMLSDKPGRDAQRSTGASLRFDWNGSVLGTLTAITSIASSDIDFSFDADWGNEESWSPVTYDYVSLTHRERRTISQELRFTAERWLVGVYALGLSEDLDTTNLGEYYDPGYDWADSLNDAFASQFESTNLALFGQRDWQVGGASTVSAGLRVEQRSTDYSDDVGWRTEPESRAQ